MERDCRYPKVFLATLWIDEKNSGVKHHIFPGERIALSYYFDDNLQMESIHAVLNGYEGYFDGHTTNKILKARKKGIIYQCFYYKYDGKENIVIIKDVDSDLQIDDFVELPL